jgi:hypothetical protein
VYEASRWEQKALDQYRLYVDAMAGADYEPEEVADARERIRRLTEIP